MMSSPSLEGIARLLRGILDDPDRGMADLGRMGLLESRHPALGLLMQLLPDAPDPDLALVHLERFSREAPIPREAEALQILVTLFGFSPYLAESLIRDPGLLSDLARVRRQGTWGVEEYRNDIARWRRISHSEDPWDALRTFKRRATLRIALKDLGKGAALPDICREISAAADALIQSGVQIVMAEAQERFGRPQSYDEAGRIVEATMGVLALGKLGGDELNYSSDIDLLFVYSADGETSGGEGHRETQITNKEFFTRMAEMLARGLGEISTEGQVFRVDCRLRPGGRDGDLVMGLQASLAYYDTWARSWERQALLKARPCAGDLALGSRFLAGLGPVIYAQAPDPGVLDAIREMKDRIDADLARRRQITSHLKLGRGGIREIEFTVQALQMMFGGAEPWIQGANTLMAMHRVADKGLLSVQEHGALSAAYTFLRDVEHRLQIQRNLQRSVLPGAARDMRILARAMGYRDSAHRQEAANFLSDLDAHREAVRATYDAVLGRLSQARLEDSPAADPFLDPMSDHDAAACLAAGGVANAGDLLGSVKAIARLLETAPARFEVRREFRRVTPILLAELGKVHNPIRALRNMERFLASLILDRAQLLQLLVRRELIPPLVRLFAGSQPLSSTLAHRPATVLAEGLEQAVSRDRTVAEHLGRLLDASAPIHDATAFAAFLRTYQRSQLVYIGLKDLNRQAGPAATGRSLSDLAEAILRAATVSCAVGCGWPRAAGDDAGVMGFSILGLGKLGYREMDYSTDLDLMFLYEEAESGACAELHARANRFAASIVETLTAITREGALYSVDTRLRPFGTAGELAQPAGRLREYFASVAAVWEMQSFLKARPLAGDLDLGWRTVGQIEGEILARAVHEDLSGSVQGMKERLEREAASRGLESTDIKQGPGGLGAIQFAIQYLQLRHGARSPVHKRTTRLLATLRSAGLIDEGVYRALFTGFQFLRKLEHQIRLIHGRALSRLPTSPEMLDEIAAALGYSQEGLEPPRERLLADLHRHRRQIEAAYRRVIERGDAPRMIEAGSPAAPSIGSDDETPKGEPGPERPR